MRKRDCIDKEGKTRSHGDVICESEECLRCEDGEWVFDWASSFGP